MSAALLVVATAFLLVAVPALFVGGKLHERYRGPSAQANAAAGMAGAKVGARHFDVATDVQAGPLTTRQYSSVRERASGGVPR